MNLCLGYKFCFRKSTKEETRGYEHVQLSAGDLIPINLEINATCRRRNAKRIRKFVQDLEAATTPKEEPRSSEASSSFPIPGQSHTDLIGEIIMVEEPRRVTLEDYSSSSVPQFFTSIAQPEVQA